MPRKTDRRHTIASIYHKGADRFWNIWFKGFLIGGVYIANRIAKYKFKQTGHRVPRRYELIREAMVTVTKKKWKGLGFCSLISRQASNILALFCAIDPAYGTLFDEWINKYNELKKKEGLR